MMLYRAHPLRAQHGVSLIELLVGVSIGLMTVAVAIGALMASRNVTGTVRDASQLQQQASHIFRTMGLQLRQAGSLYLRPNDAADINAPVAFEITVSGFDPKKNTLSGIDNPAANEYKITTGYRNYTESLFSSTTNASQHRDCLGQTGSDTLIQSRFVLQGTNLMCAGTDTAQPIASNVANFQVRYLLQTFPNGMGDPQLQYVSATTVGTNWANVYGVEVCLVLFGDERIDLPAQPADASYPDCPSADGTVTAVDMRTLTGLRAQRMHKTFRTVFQLRSQGLLTNY